MLPTASQVAESLAGAAIKQSAKCSAPCRVAHVQRWQLIVFFVATTLI